MRLREIASEYPASDNRQRDLGHDDVLEKYVRVLWLQSKNSVREHVESVIRQREKRSPQGHGRGHALHRINRVIQSVPIANKRIQINERQHQPDQGHRQPVAVRAEKCSD